MQNNRAMDLPSIISAKCDLLKEILTRECDETVFTPIGIFSNLTPLEQIKVRIDNELSKIKSSNGNSRQARLNIITYLLLWDIYNDYSP